jgi:hypothetical protein
VPQARGSQYSEEQTVLALAGFTAGARALGTIRPDADLDGGDSERSQRIKSTTAGARRGRELFEKPPRRSGPYAAVLERST